MVTWDAKKGCFAYEAFFKSWDEKEGEIKINFCFNELQHKWVKGFEMTLTGYAGSYYIFAKKLA
jgi:hypothetical protein